MTWRQWVGSWLMSLGFFYLGLALGWVADALIPGTDDVLAILYVLGLVFATSGIFLQHAAGREEQ